MSLVAAAIIAICLVALVVVLKPPTAEAPGSSGSGDLNPVVEQADQGQEPQQERTEVAARQAAQALMDTYSAGGYGEFWDAWVPEAQALISRDDYVRLFQLCKPIAEGLRFEITGVTLRGDIADVRVNRLIVSFTYQFRYEGGRWRYIPDQQAQADYKTKNVDQMVAEKRAARTCAA
ncbi:hypothetical protein [Microbispora sp. GKU 823]|uniref:hypothetical protein n=1 Tax=Microbispora sp. GKU 823 TaxID=1652100 RepID=UPI0009A3811B|nr:hypothetical protein [Microbispora sp. GKU 823]OPG09293.1 hypothetical protein B1L11_26155 [Microbispora sp. GKU 823]